MRAINKIITLACFAVSTFGSFQAFADSDSDISSAINNKLHANAITANSKINVSTKQGVVYLSGNLETMDEASSAIETANSFAGVKDVDTDGLMVKNSNHLPYNDTYITAKVKSSFLREKIFGDQPIDVMSIHVETKDGIVYLTGTAENRAQENSAISIAKSIKGVKDVDSKVMITQ